MSRTSPFFVPQKEVNLINDMNEELIDEIVGQSVDVYKVNIENTDENIYGESSTKYYDIAFRVNCLLLYNEPTIEQDESDIIEEEKSIAEKMKKAAAAVTLDDLQGSYE